MKKILIAVAAVVLLYPVVAWLTGLAIERRLENLAYQSGPGLTITRHYHRGWFSSVDDATIDRAPLHVSIRTVIHHGPICGWTCFALAGADTHLSFTGPVQVWLTQLFGKQEPVAIRSRFGFLGGGTTMLLVPRLDHARLAKDTSLSWDGIEGTIDYGAGFDRYSMVATVPSLHIEGAKGAVEIEGASLDLHARRALRTLYAGDSRLELKHFAASSQDNSGGIAVDEIILTSQQQVQDRFMDASYRLGTGAIQTQPLTLSGAHFDFTWKHLGIEPLESLVTALRSVRQNQNARAAPVAQMQNMMIALKQQVASLLLDQPEMDIDRVSVATAQGQGLVTGVVRLPGVNNTDLEVPALLLQKLDVQLDISLDEAFLSGLPGAGANVLAQLQPMIEQGYITRSNGHLRTQLLLRAGQPTLNGKRFTPGAVRTGYPAP